MTDVVRVFDPSYSPPLQTQAELEAEPTNWLEGVRAGFASARWIGGALKDIARALTDENLAEYSFDERIALINEARRRDWQDTYGQVDTESTAFTVGRVAGLIFDPAFLPTLLIPTALPLRTALATGAAIGGGAAAIESVASTGEVEAAPTFLGALIGGGSFAALSLLRPGVSRALLPHVKRERQAAKSLVEQFQRELDLARLEHPITRPPADASGPSLARFYRDVYNRALERSGINEAELAQAVKISQRVPLVREDIEDAARALGKPHFSGAIADALIPVIDRLERIAPPVAGRLHESFARMMLLSSKIYERGAKPLIEAYERLSPEDKVRFHELAIAGDRAGVEALVGKEPVEAWMRWSRYGFEAANIKAGTKPVEGFYMPRRLKPEIAEKVVESAAFRKFAERYPNIDEAKAAWVLRSSERAPGKATALHERKAAGTRPDIFLPLPQALSQWFTEIQHEGAMRYFLGLRGMSAKEARKVLTRGGAVKLDPALSKILDTESAELVKAVFEAYRKTPSRSIQNVRNVTYGILLGNPFAAAAQLGDLPIGFVAHGLRAELAALFNRPLKAVDLGIKLASEELSSSPLRSARFLDKALRLGGFSKMDFFGKDVHVSAALRWAMRLARDNPERLTRMFGPVFSKNWPRILADLRAGRPSDWVKTFILYRLNQIQPILPTAMPKTWLENPANVRVWAYMLRTFVLRTAAFAFAEARRRGGVQGVAFAAGMAAAWALAGAQTTTIRNIMRGKEPTLEDAAGGAVDNFINLVIGSRYYAMKAWRDRDIDTLITNTLVSIPPLVWLQRLGADIMSAAQRGDIDLKDLESIRDIPTFGEIWYWWFGGGFEQAVQKEWRKLHGRP